MEPLRRAEGGYFVASLDDWMLAFQKGFTKIELTLLPSGHSAMGREIDQNFDPDSTNPSDIKLFRDSVAQFQTANNVCTCQKGALCEQTVVAIKSCMRQSVRHTFWCSSSVLVYTCVCLCVNCAQFNALVCTASNSEEWFSLCYLVVEVVCNVVRVVTVLHYV